MTTQEKVIIIVNQQLGTLATEDSTMEELGADSLDFIELIMTLEEEFEIEITDEEAEAANSVSKLITLVEGKL